RPSSGQGYRPRSSGTWAWPPAPTTPTCRRPWRRCSSCEPSERSKRACSSRFFTPATHNRRTQGRQYAPGRKACLRFSPDSPTSAVSQRAWIVSAWGGGMSAIVELEDVVKEYPLGKVVVKAVRGVTMTIDRGDFVAIAGPSGSGKTTVLNMIGCVDVPTRGVVRVDGQKTNNLDDKALTALRLHKLGFIFQSFNLIAVLDLFQNVEFPLLLKGGMTKLERKKQVEKIIESVGLSDQMRQR